MPLSLVEIFQGAQSCTTNVSRIAAVRDGVGQWLKGTPTITEIALAEVEHRHKYRGYVAMLMAMLAGERVKMVGQIGGRMFLDRDPLPLDEPRFELSSCTGADLRVKVGVNPMPELTKREIELFKLAHNGEDPQTIYATVPAFPDVAKFRPGEALFLMLQRGWGVRQGRRMMLRGRGEDANGDPVVPRDSWEVFEPAGSLAPGVLADMRTRGVEPLAPELLADIRARGNEV